MSNNTTQANSIEMKLHSHTRRHARSMRENVRNAKSSDCVILSESKTSLNKNVIKLLDTKLQIILCDESNCSTFIGNLNVAIRMRIFFFFCFLSLDHSFPMLLCSISVSLLKYFMRTHVFYSSIFVSWKMDNGFPHPLEMRSHNRTRGERKSE